MKTTQFIMVALLGFSSFLGLAQVMTANVTSYGLSAGNSSTNSTSSYFGYQAGNSASTTTPTLGNTFIGYQSGKSTTTGNSNTYVGSYSGSNNTGSNNVGVGLSTLSINTTAINYNTALGTSAGQQMTGNNNVMLGYSAGQFINGSDNVLLGYKAGYSNYGSGPFTGTGNVLIGNNVGGNMGLSNKLMIDNSATATPLIWGDFANDQVKLNGKVGVGSVGTFPTTAGSVNVSNYRLFVTGGILADEVRVNLSSGGTWADYVFAKGYNLKPLTEVEQFIKNEGHLPNVPSAKQIQEDGIALGEMAKIQQEKIEELTLYIIALNKEIQALKAANQKGTH
ncbi:MAG: hypothetical protein JST78_05095 [Bacteroidetes bacterium]|nr:hypothetical protein [Bacteroidota bacterium]